MDNQIFLTNSELKPHKGEDNLKGKRTNKKGKLAKKDKTNTKEIKNKKNGKLSPDEKDFLAMLVHLYLKKEPVKNKKGINTVSKVDGEKKIRIRKMVKEKATKNDKNAKVKKDVNLQAEKLLKGKEKYSRTNNEKIALEKIMPSNKNRKTNNKKIKEKAPEIKNSKESDVKLELQNKKEKAKLDKAKVSKIEEIKISPNTKEIKIENLKITNPKGETPTVRKSNLVEEVARIIQNTNPEGSKIFRIHLEPPDLGKIYIQLTFSQDKKMDMKVYVQKPEVQHYLNSGIDTLKTNIENIGLKFDTPVIQTLSEFNSGEKGDGKDKEGETQKKIKFKVYMEGKESSDYYEEYIGVMDYLSGKVDIRA